MITVEITKELEAKEEHVSLQNEKIREKHKRIHFHTKLIFAPFLYACIQMPQMYFSFNFSKEIFNIVRFYFSAQPVGVRGKELFL